MKQLKIRNTYQINPAGKPDLSLEKNLEIESLAVLPSSIPYIKPKLMLKQGDKVKKGQPLFFDKKQEGLFFCSPAGGTIEAINYGPRRRLDEVVIKRDQEEDSVRFPMMTESDIFLLDKKQIVDECLKRGLWGSFREFPFKNIPTVETVPPAIYVSIDQDEPYMPQAEVVLKNRINDLKVGVALLKKVTDQVVIAVSEKNKKLKEELHNIVTHEIQGDYPAMNPGTILYYNKTSQKDNKSWTIQLQHLLNLVAAFKTGEYPTEKVIVLAGALSHKKTHVLTREGASIDALCEGSEEREPTRYIAGGVLTGRQSKRESFLGFDDFALHQIREGGPQEMLSFFGLGAKKHTKSRTYLAGLYDQAEFEFSSQLNGGHRSCIACGECPKVCPNDVLPQLLMKSILAKDIEESLDLGLLDCSECGLCSYVCPSKIELDDIIDQGKKELAKEALK